MNGCKIQQSTVNFDKREEGAPSMATKVWKTLPELKPRPLPPPSISDEAEEKKASAVDIEQPESNLQIL